MATALRKISILMAVLSGLTVFVFPLSPAVMAETTPAQITPRWQTLPPTPELPAPLHCGYTPVNGIKLWHAGFGDGVPVILLHGGLANANYWGHQVPVLAKHYRVIVLDSRGHGRSTRDEHPFSYDLMTDDVIGLMNFLGLPKATIVGWSDGAIIGIDLAIRYPERINKVFAFAANTDPSGAIEGAEKSSTFAAYLSRTEQEYARLSATPGRYPEFVEQISQMWKTQPNFTKKQLASIQVPVLIVDGDHDEAIRMSHTKAIASAIPGAKLLIQPNASHFSFLQDPARFTNDILHFLK